MAENTDKMISDEISDKIVDIAEAIAIKDGVKNISVRRILREMNVTNRVFYNRFHNLNEVLEIIYKRAVFKMHECIKSEFDLKTDFFNYAVDVSTKVLVSTYKVKNQFSQYMFEHDSYSDANRNWWTKKIKEIIETAKATGQIKNVDSDMLSYTIWCFFRGYNADAVNRGLSVEAAVESFEFGLGFFLDGLRK